MAYRTVIRSLFLKKSLSAGDIATSDKINLQDIAQTGTFSLSAVSAVGTAGTQGTTVFTYSCSSFEDGLYVTPASATAIGTVGTAATSTFFSFSPELTPWMKIVATQTGAGTAGYDSKISAELHVR